MKQDKPDRRSQRTRRLVISALMELMAEKPYDAITIQQVLDRAGIGRSTFYKHYYDKEDVLASLAEQMLEMLSQQFSQRETEQGILPSLELFQHIDRNHQHLRTQLRGQGLKVVWEVAQASLRRNIEQGLAATFEKNGTPSVPLEVMAQYLAGAFFNLLKWWVETETPHTPAQMDEMFRQMALSGMWATLEGKGASPQRDVF